MVLDGVKSCSDGIPSTSLWAGFADCPEGVSLSDFRSKPPRRKERTTHREEAQAAAVAAVAAVVVVAVVAAVAVATRAAIAPES